MAEPAAPSVGDGPSHRTVEALLRERLASALGGWRGAAEAAVPTIAFVLWWTVTSDLRGAVLASAVGVGVAVVVRLLQRQTVRYALSSVLATAIAAAVALRSGRAEDAFLPSILWNLALGLLYVGSVAVRWPVLGFVIAVADPRLADVRGDEEPDLSVLTAWRGHRGTVAVCARLTLVLAALMLVRVTVMLPLYLAGQVALLGVAKIALGWPAYLIVIAAMAALLLRGDTPLDD